MKVVTTIFAMVFVVCPCIVSALQDEVMRADKPKISGIIIEDSFTRVRIRTSTGKEEIIPRKDVVEVKYSDVFEEYSQALEAIKGSRFQQALTLLKDARDFVDRSKKTDPKFKIRDWFEEHYEFYTAMCQKYTGKTQEALLALEKFMSRENSRFIADAFNLALDCVREIKDLKKAEFLERQASVRFARRDPILPIIAKVLTANLLFADRKFKDTSSKCREILNLLSKVTDKGSLESETRILLLQSLLGLPDDEAHKKDKQELVTLAKNIMDNKSSPSDLALFANGVLGKVEFNNKEYIKCVKRLSKAMVHMQLKDPKSDVKSADNTSIDTEWIYILLARSYEELAKSAKGVDKNAERAYFTMCVTMYKETQSTFEKSQFKTEIDQKLKQYQFYLPKTGG